MNYGEKIKVLKMVDENEEWCIKASVDGKQVEKGNSKVQCHLTAIPCLMVHVPWILCKFIHCLVMHLRS